MDIWAAEKLPLFLVFIVPGFVSLKVWDLLVPGERRRLDGALIDLVAYSTLNFVLLAWLIVPLLSGRWHGLPAYVAMVSIFLVFPVLWPIFWKWLRTRKWMSGFAIHPMARPWDYVFAKREPAWVIVHMKDGSVIGGRFGGDSFASSWPAAEQIYIEELWQLDAQGDFIKAVDRSHGAIILGTEIRAIEFFEYADTGAQDHV